MVIIVLGPQGSGKTTQAKLLAKRFNLQHFSVGKTLRDILKDTHHPLYSKIYKSYIKGELVEDSIVNKLLHNALINSFNFGIVVDGTPRNFSQLKEIDKTLRSLGKKIDFVFFIDTSIQESKKRLLKRAKIEQRVDDTPESIDTRLKIYHKNINPILKEYSKRGVLIRVDGNKNIESIHEELSKILQKNLNKNDNK